MKLFVRNKARYNPEVPDNNLISVVIKNYADTYIWQIKEIAKKQRALKLEELFHFSDNGMLRLEDGRTIAHYNLVDGDILESTSNPFFVACMYILAIEAKRKHAHNDKKMQAVMRKSYIRKYSIIGVLFNSAKDNGDTQPPYFKNVDTFITFVKAHKKKGVDMSVFTERSLWKLWDEYTTVDIVSPDPIRSFVARYRDRMGLYNQGNPDIDPDDPEFTDVGDDVGTRHWPLPQGSHNRGDNYQQRQIQNQRQQNSKVKKKNSESQTANTKKKDPRLCDNCDNQQAASHWCEECDGGEGLALCHMCLNFLHLRRKHNHIKDISEAPKVAKQYVPHAYRAPFALLIGLFSGHTKEPKKLSMTEDELREIAQGLTDTDLYDRSPGKRFGGFDSIDTLITKDLLKREATQRPTYALKQSGIDLAKRLLKYHTAVLNLMKEFRVPCVPQNSCDNLLLDGNMLVLVVDEMERKKTRMVDLTQKRGMSTEVRNLPSGDYIWLLRVNGNEMVLPCIVERKTWDDFHNTIQDNRFFKQINSMKRLGFRNRFYLVEGNIMDMRGKPTTEQKQCLQLQLQNIIVQHGFKVNYTSSWFKTSEWLTQLTHILAQAYKQGQIELLPYAEYARLSRKAAVTTDDQRIPVYHHWMAEDYVNVISGENEIERPFVMQRIKEKLNIEGPLPTEQHLLLIQGLEVYNKGRQKLLNDALNVAFSDKSKPVKELVKEPLILGLRNLLHYDVQQYFSLCMQMFLDIYVVRKEAMEDVVELKQYFVNSKAVGGQYTHVKAKAQHSVASRFEPNQGNNFENDDDDFKKALALSLQDTGSKLTSQARVKRETSCEDNSFQKMKEGSKILKSDVVSDPQDIDSDIRLALELSLKDSFISKKSNMNIPGTILPKLEQNELIAGNLTECTQKYTQDDETKRVLGSEHFSKDTDEILARKLQDSFNNDESNVFGISTCSIGNEWYEQSSQDDTLTSDEVYAKKLQEELNREDSLRNTTDFCRSAIPNVSQDEEYAKKLQRELNDENLMRGEKLAQVNEDRLFNPNKDSCYMHTSTPVKIGVTRYPKTTTISSTVTHSSVKKLGEETYTQTSVREATRKRSFQEIKVEREKYNSQLGSYRLQQQEKYHGKIIHQNNNSLPYESNSKRKVTCERVAPSTVIRNDCDRVMIDSDDNYDDVIPVKKRMEGTKFESSKDVYSPCRSLNTEPTTDSSAERQGNMTCGACKEKGHNRKWKFCPKYYTDEEMKRREKDKEARKEKREQELKLQQDAINALVRTEAQQRDGMVASLQSTQEHFQSTIGNISTLIGTIQRKGKTAKKNPT